MGGVRSGALRGSIDERKHHPRGRGRGGHPRHAVLRPRTRRLRGHRGRRRRGRAPPPRRPPARSRHHRLDAAGHERTGSRTPPASGSAHGGAAAHHAHGQGRRGRQAEELRRRHRRLRHQTLLAPRTRRAHQGRPAPQRCPGGRPAPVRSHGAGHPEPPPVDRRGERAHRSDRIPAPRVPHAPSGAGLRPGAAPGPRLGPFRVRRGAYRGRPHPAPAQGPRPLRSGGLGTDGPRRRLPLLPCHG